MSPGMATGNSDGFTAALQLLFPEMRQIHPDWQEILPDFSLAASLSRMPTGRSSVAHWLADLMDWEPLPETLPELPPMVHLGAAALEEELLTAAAAHHYQRLRSIVERDAIRELHALPGQARYEFCLRVVPLLPEPPAIDPAGNSLPVTRQEWLQAGIRCLSFALADLPAGVRQRLRLRLPLPGAINAFPDRQPGAGQQSWRNWLNRVNKEYELWQHFSPR